MYINNTMYKIDMELFIHITYNCIDDIFEGQMFLTFQPTKTTDYMVIYTYEQ